MGSHAIADLSLQFRGPVRLADTPVVGGTGVDLELARRRLLLYTLGTHSC
jgi:hypothetical protein